MLGGGGMSLAWLESVVNNSEAATRECFSMDMVKCKLGLILDNNDGVGAKTLIDSIGGLFCFRTVRVRP